MSFFLSFETKNGGKKEGILSKKENKTVADGCLKGCDTKGRTVRRDVCFEIYHSVILFSCLAPNVRQGLYRRLRRGHLCQWR